MCGGGGGMCVCGGVCVCVCARVCVYEMLKSLAVYMFV